MPRTHPPEVAFAAFLWIWNRRLAQQTPRVHLRIARWLNGRVDAGDTRLLLMAFRGCGKSTIIGLFCAWLLSRDASTRIVVLAADHSLATKMVSAVRRIIERHPLCAHLLPDGTEVWAADRFGVVRSGAPRDPSMMAQGIQGNFTGSRADVIICDDVEVPNTADTDDKRAALRERLSETEFVLTPGGTLLFIGTPHAAETIYREGEGALLAGYARLTVPLLDAAGRSAWPERFDADAIARLRRRVGPRRFARQMQLSMAAEEEAQRLDPALMIRYREALELREANGAAQLWLGRRRLVTGVAWWDPAFGRPGRGDHSVLAAVFGDDRGSLFLHRIAYLAVDPAAAPDPATQQCRAVARLTEELFLPVVFVETNGIGRFLPDLLRQTAAELGVPLAVREQSSSRRKEERILAAFDPVLAARRLHAHESVFATSFAAEMAGWKPGAAGVKDDALDAVAGALLAEPARLPRRYVAARPPPWRGGATPPVVAS